MARRAPAEQPAATDRPATDRPAAERDGDLVVVSGRRPPLATARAFLRLTKPRVIELLLITTVPAMVLAAGAWPGPALVIAVLVGWAAVTGSLAAPAWVLFALVFVWTPAHFWALAIRYLDDYRSGGFPMLPVVRGVPKACDQILLYAGATVCTSLLLPLVADVSWIYLATAAGLGGWFVWRSYRLRRDPTPQGAIRLFSASNAYLAGVFIAVAADVLVLGR